MKYFIIGLTLFGSAAMACPAGTFTATYGDRAVAKIRGNEILSKGWTVYSKVDSDEALLTRFKHRESKVALWRYEYKNGKQPGIVWGVWADGGMIEGFGNIYEIQTNLRSIGGGEATLIPHEKDGSRFKVTCGH